MDRNTALENNKLLSVVARSKIVPDPETGDLKLSPSSYNTYARLEHAKKLPERKRELNSTVPLPLSVGSILRGLVNRSTTSSRISGQQIALDLIRKGEKTWVYTTYSFAHVPLYQFLRMVMNAAGSDAASNMTDAQRVVEDGAGAVDDECELEQEDDENDDERITFSNRPITDKDTIADHYMLRPNELESLSLYDFVQCCRLEPTKAATNYAQHSEADNSVTPEQVHLRHAGVTGMGNDDECDGEITTVDIAQESHKSDAFLHEINPPFRAALISE
ncbi:hypothetical protein H9P43_006674 [Blastocladiella emersonii ATCC 22665]|nr:hypothetical protein H9P43_006674 [Blastocladiella emersonii ATCC 22665]